LVLELVEGETLAGKLTALAGRPLGVDEALAIARQVADALQAAHDKGIVHRDLKPANIAITDEGQVKVLDFGLAKLEPIGAESPAAGLTHSPTLTFAATQAGMILGTGAYMSPEQAKGKSTDKRTDVWAFACVLYDLQGPLCAARRDVGPDGTIVFATADTETGLFSVSANGGDPKLLTTPDREHEGDHVFPSFLPGATKVLYTILPKVAGGPAQIAVLDLKSGPRTTALPTPPSPQSLPGPHLAS